jgi:hypothetical protein
MRPSQPGLERPPFRVIEALGPQQVAAEMVACFDLFACLPDRAQRAFGLAMTAIGLDPRDPLCIAGQRIAADIDAGIGLGNMAGYHHAGHLCDVLLSSLYLACLVKLDRRHSALLVLAALIHDFHHDGTGNGSEPFRLEALAVRGASAYLESARVTGEEQALLAALVLATDFVAGCPFARACHAAHDSGQPMPAVPEQAPELRKLLERPEFALQAMLLIEADILPSVGLTLEYAQRMQARLAAEWQRPLGPDDKLAFIDKALDNVIVGTFFLPNMHASRQFFLRQAEETRATGGNPL